MYQVVQKKFNLCVVVICNCFISLVNMVLFRNVFFSFTVSALQLAMPLVSARVDVGFLKCIHAV